MSSLQLCRATVRGDIDEARRLLADGACDIDAICSWRASLTPSPFFHPDTDLVRDGVVEECEYKSRALHLAVLAGRIDMVAFLIDEGADPNELDGLGRTPILCAVFGLDTLRATESNLTYLALEHPAHVAILRDHLLPHPRLSRRTLHDPQVAVLGLTLVCLAAYLDKLEALELLLDVGGVSPDSRDGSDATPLMYAARDGHLEIVEALLDRGADPLLIDGNGFSVFQHGQDFPNVLQACQASVQERGIKPKIHSRQSSKDNGYLKASSQVHRQQGQDKVLPSLSPRSSPVYPKPASSPEILPAFSLETAVGNDASRPEDERTGHDTLPGHIQITQRTVDDICADFPTPPAVAFDPSQRLDASSPAFRAGDNGNMPTADISELDASESPYIAQLERNIRELTQNLANSDRMLVEHRASYERTIDDYQRQLGKLAAANANLSRSKPTVPDQTGTEANGQHSCLSLSQVERLYQRLAELEYELDDARNVASIANAAIDPSYGERPETQHSISSDMSSTLLAQELHLDILRANVHEIDQDLKHTHERSVTIIHEIQEARELFAQLSSNNQAVESEKSAAEARWRALVQRHVKLRREIDQLGRDRQQNVSDIRKAVQQIRSHHPTRPLEWLLEDIKSAEDDRNAAVGRRVRELEREPRPGSTISLESVLSAGSFEAMFSDPAKEERIRQLELELQRSREEARNNAEKAEQESRDAALMQQKLLQELTSAHGITGSLRQQIGLAEKECERYRNRLASIVQIKKEEIRRALEVASAWEIELADGRRIVVGDREPLECSQEPSDHDDQDSNGRYTGSEATDRKDHARMMMALDRAFWHRDNVADQLDLYAREVTSQRDRNEKLIQVVLDQIREKLLRDDDHITEAIESVFAAELGKVGNGSRIVGANVGADSPQGSVRRPRGSRQSTADLGADDSANTIDEWRYSSSVGASSNRNISGPVSRNAAIAAAKQTKNHQRTESTQSRPIDAVSEDILEDLEENAPEPESKDVILSSPKNDNPRRQIASTGHHPRNASNTSWSSTMSTIVIPNQLRNAMSPQFQVGARARSVDARSAKSSGAQSSRQGSSIADGLESRGRAPTVHSRYDFNQDDGVKRREQSQPPGSTVQMHGAVLPPGNAHLIWRDVKGVTPRRATVSAGSDIASDASSAKAGKKQPFSAGLGHHPNASDERGRRGSELSSDTFGVPSRNDNDASAGDFVLATSPSSSVRGNRLHQLRPPSSSSQGSSRKRSNSSVLAAAQLRRQNDPAIGEQLTQASRLKAEISLLERGLVQQMKQQRSLDTMGRQDGSPGRPMDKARQVLSKKRDEYLQVMAHLADMCP